MPLTHTHVDIGYTTLIKRTHTEEANTQIHTDLCWPANAPCHCTENVNARIKHPLACGVRHARADAARNPIINRAFFGITYSIRRRQVQSREPRSLSAMYVIRLQPVPNSQHRRNPIQQRRSACARRGQDELSVLGI